MLCLTFSELLSPERKRAELVFLRYDTKDRHTRSRIRHCPVCRAKRSRPNVERTLEIRATKSPAFDKVDRVERVQLWQQRRPRQAVEFDVVASLYGRATKSKRRH